MVVGDASDPDSPLHAYFDWNDANAAHRYRLEQARRLIRSVKLVVETTEDSRAVPVYVRDPAAPDEQQGYRALASIKSDDDGARAVLEREMGRVASCLHRARAVASVLGLEHELDDLLMRTERVAHSVAA
jgi:hypothetical protein